MLDILKKYQSIQHQRRRLNVIFGNGLRQLGVREEIIPLRDEQGAYLFLIEITVSPNISRTPTAIQENFMPSKQTAGAGISRICRKIDSRVNVRIDTQPPGYGSEPHLDFIVTDLDGMLAQLCGPDRKIIRLRDKRGIYLFLIEITAITKYLADADGGSRRILRSRPLLRPARPTATSSSPQQPAAASACIASASTSLGADHAAVGDDADAADAKTSAPARSKARFAG